MTTSLSFFFLTGIQCFATIFQLIYVFFVRQIVRQFNQKISDPNFSNLNELFSDHFLICKLKKHVNRIWSFLIFLFDAICIIIFVVVGFLLATHSEIETETKIVLVFWVVLLIFFFLTLNIPAIWLNEESDESIGAVFQRFWAQRKAKLFLNVSFSFLAKIFLNVSFFLAKLFLNVSFFF